MFTQALREVSVISVTVGKEVTFYYGATTASWGIVHDMDTSCKDKTQSSDVGYYTLFLPYEDKEFFDQFEKRKIKQVTVRYILDDVPTELSFTGLVRYKEVEVTNIAFGKGMFPFRYLEFHFLRTR